MITINQYLKLITDFLGSHKMINTVSVSDKFNFNADSGNVYRVGHVEYVTQSIQNTNIVHQFEITIADLFDPNIPNSVYDIYSDCNLIAADVIDYFANQYDVDYTINENVSIQKFSNGNVDRVAGCVFVLSFNQFREANICFLPVEQNINAVTGAFGVPFSSEFQ